MCEERRTIGEVVGGLHGGKYDFSAGGTQHSANEFAAALASSGTQQTEPAQIIYDGSRPTWVRRMRAASLSGVLRFGQKGNAECARVTNIYRTWEEYFAVTLASDAIAGTAWESLVARAASGAELESDPESDLMLSHDFDLEAVPDPAFEIRVASGVLAPRGGADNVCDPSKPYRQQPHSHHTLSQHAEPHHPGSALAEWVPGAEPVPCGTAVMLWN